MNRTRLARDLTKREEAALRVFTAMVRKHDPYPAYDIYVIAADAVAHADALFDELDTPNELRGEGEIRYPKNPHSDYSTDWGDIE